MPVDDGHEVHPSLEQSDIGDVNPPDMVRVLGHDIAKKVGIDLVLQSPLAKIGPRMDPLDSYLPHGGLDARSSHREPFTLENGCNATTPVEWPGGYRSRRSCAEEPPPLLRESSACNKVQIGILPEGWPVWREETLDKSGSTNPLRCL